MVKKLILFLFVISFIGTLHGQQRINPDYSKATFEISNMGFKTVEGSFDGMNGRISFDASDLASSSFNVCIDARSVDTGNEQRDEHLLEEDFFAVETFPQICFESTTVTSNAEGFVTKGTLMMHGVSKEVEMPFTFIDNQFQGTLSIDRTDFGVGSNGGFMVGKDVDLIITCQLF